MQTLNRLVRAAAHEIKNPLAIILQGVEHLKQSIRSDDKTIYLTLNYIEDAAKRIDSVISGVVDFFSLSELDIKSADFTSIIENALLSLKEQFDKNHIQIIKNFKGDIPLVKVDKNRIEHVLVGLFLNAIQAMPSGGNLTIKTSTQLEPTEEVWVIAQIEDSGCGMSEDVLKNIFTPFFTTKLNLQALGLGLSIARNIIQMHGGKIEIENRTDNPGVRVTVMLKI